jgi:hypothetical protein
MPPVKHRSFTDLLKLAAECDLNEFQDIIDSPYLVATGTLAGRVEPGNVTKDTGFLQLDDQHPGHTLSGKNPLAGQVLAVMKSMRDDPGRIYVGRAASNDLVIEDRSISSRHGWFERQGEAVLIADAGSRNGTFVNLARIDKAVAQAVKDEDVVTFGRVSFQFFNPVAMYFALRAFTDPT